MEFRGLKEENTKDLLKSPFSLLFSGRFLLGLSLVPGD